MEGEKVVMNIFAKNAIMKKFLIVLITMIMISNFIMPNFAYADDDSDEKGGKLFTPITELLLGIADRVEATLEAIFVGDFSAGDILTASEIKQKSSSQSGQINFGPWDGRVDVFHIKYSPAIIFSGKVPALDIDFITPMSEEDRTFYTYDYKYDKAESKDITWKEAQEQFGAPKTLQMQRGSSLAYVFSNTDAYYSTWYATDPDTGEKIQYFFIHDENNLGFIGTTLANVLDFANAPQLLSIPSLLGDIFTGNFEFSDLKEFLRDSFSITSYFKNNSKTLNQILGTYEIDGDGLKGTLYKVTQVPGKTVTKESTAGNLKPIIKKYYLALRTFALVGLLSVLVYIGIRIILSSNSSQNQAKYKAMLKDWLVAICILFLMHYIMAFILDITGKVTEIFKVNTIVTQEDITQTGNVQKSYAYEIGDDSLMSDIRNQITGEDSNWTYFGYVLMYIALVILTVTFTIEYLKRVIFIAFLTMVSPLISLTYPLDKIRDGHAQAFGIWTKEYIFNCLIQPVHLLMYTIFIDSAIGLMDVNPLYAIVAMAFFRPAEKFFKKMFGFDQASSISTLGAAAGGAMVMNMLNKLQGRPPKDSSKASSASSASTKGVRNATRVPTITTGTTTGNSQPLTTMPQGQTGIQSAAGTIQPTGIQSGAGVTQPMGTQNGAVVTQPMGTQNGAGVSQPIGTQNGAVVTQPMKTQNGAGMSQPIGTQSAAGTSNTTTTTPKPSRRKGFGAVAKKIVGPDVIKSTGRWALRNSSRAAGAFAGATLGFAAGLADGDFELPVKNLALGATLGAKGGENLVGNTVHGVTNALEGISETYNKGKYGEEVYSNMQFDKEFFKSESFKQIKQDPSIDQTNIKQRVQQFLDNGVTDGTKIREALQKGVSGDEYTLYNKAGITSVSDMAKLTSNGVPMAWVKGYSNNLVTRVQDMERLFKANVSPEAAQGYRDAGITNIRDMETLAGKISPEAAQRYRDAGINKVSDITMLNDSNVIPELAQEYRKLGINKISDMTKLKEADIGPDKMKRYLNAGIKNPDRIARMQEPLRNETKENLRAKNVLANDAIKAGKNKDFESFKDYIRSKNPKLLDDEDEVKKLFDNLTAYSLVI